MTLEAPPSPFTGIRMDPTYHGKPLVEQMGLTVLPLQVPFLTVGPSSCSTPTSGYFDPPLLTENRGGDSGELQITVFLSETSKTPNRKLGTSCDHQMVVFGSK